MPGQHPLHWPSHQHHFGFLHPGTLLGQCLSNFCSNQISGRRHKREEGYTPLVRTQRCREEPYHQQSSSIGIWTQRTTKGERRQCQYSQLEWYRVHVQMVWRLTTCGFLHATFAFNRMQHSLSSLVALSIILHIIISMFMHVTSPSQWPPKHCLNDGQ